MPFYAESAFLPRVRRRDKIWRPVFVAILARKPWRRLRRKLLG
jgi:hypothetical protein